MLKYILKRLLSLLPVLFVVSVLVTMIVHLMPGDPARVIAGDMATEEDVERVRVAYGLDLPIYKQYLRYMAGVLKGDLGTSTRTHRPVADDLKIRFPKTFQLAIFATLVASLIGVGIGILSASMRYCELRCIIGACHPAVLSGNDVYSVFLCATRLASYLIRCSIYRPSSSRCKCKCKKPCSYCKNDTFKHA